MRADARLAAVLRRPRRRPICSATLRPSCPARASAVSSRTIERGVPAPSRLTWSATAVCIENVIVCRTGSASVFHCGVSEPPTAMKPADARLEHALVDPERHGRLAARPPCMRTSSSMIATSALGPSSRSPSSFRRPVTVREMIGVLTISASHSTSFSQNHQASSGSGASGPLGAAAPPAARARPPRRRLGGPQRGLQQDLGAAAWLPAPEA